MGKTFPSGVDDCWETYALALTDTILCLTMISATLLALLSVNEAIRMHANNSNETTVVTFSNCNLLHGHYTLLPFPSALMSLCADTSWGMQLIRVIDVFTFPPWWQLE